MPLGSLDAATYLKNGQDAQRLNAEFASLNANDTCLSGQRACISGSYAQCVRGLWKTENCTASEQCYALPATVRNGTFLSCTTEAVAESIINATGAAGGIAVNGSSTTSNATSPKQPSSPFSIQAMTTNTATLTQASTGVVPLVSSSGSIITLAPQTTIVTTRTLDPAEASSLLASLTADGLLSSTTPINSLVPVILSSLPVITPEPTTTLNIEVVNHFSGTSAVTFTTMC
ncbi:uncharacterized protein FIBRA_03269 [Fibroporia radiculosa]|uniref:Carbohydrate-binding module family 19 domain-containing protein n=1 Tax=Fibroporia radiculosa TaxID=599839 RepID=J4I9I5_9APHY|nr:uncharacterized protein FIBRA_03269 [Fibroporia radiculosa]CCM01221.1 predicted protein [Fibroporia radiculosa]